MGSKDVTCHFGSSDCCEISHPPTTHLRLQGYTAAALQEKVSQSLQGAGNFPSMLPGSVKRIHSCTFYQERLKSPKTPQSGTSVVESNRWYKMLAHVLAPYDPTSRIAVCGP